MVSVKKPLGLRLREKLVNWLLKDVHIERVKFGSNSVDVSDVVAFDNATAPNGAGEIGMVTNRLQYYDGGSARDVPGEHEVMLLDGTNAMGANINMGANQITNVGNVDGVDVSALKTSFDTHDGSDAKSQHTNGLGTHTHQSAGAEGGQLDHGLALTGLADDDHTQYSLADGSRAFTNPVTGQTPTSSGHLATKGYIDGLIDGLDWQESVLDRYDPSGGLPGGPGTGDRYISTATANGWTQHHIYEYNGASWTDITPNEGYCCRVEDENIDYVFNGATWVTKASGTDHGSLAGLGDDDHAQYHNDARGDARYYTETELDAGQLDNRYYRENEHINASAGGGDAGKPIVLDAGGHIDASMLNDADVDHGNLGGLGDDDHSQYLLANGGRALSGTWTAGDQIIRPSSASGGGVGDATHKYTNGYFVTCHTGDIDFLNGWKLTEKWDDGKYGPRDDIKKVKTIGLAILNERGQEALWIDAQGNLHARNLKTSS